ncbi:MAG: succinylglutamate desuccinylase/aspartoacylase family protein [Bacteriovoracaceae bacterium]|nr:succinylglutamate desuccinylase/aspartoacylase family protein [Bacteriovoracaceae bacterium]
MTLLSTIIRAIYLTTIALVVFLTPERAIAKSEAIKVKKQKLYYGKTKSGKKLYVIRMHKEDHKLPMRPAVIVTGGVHGNEYMGLVKGIAQKVDENGKGFKEFFTSGGVVYFFPEVNPDGVVKKNRFNNHGMDLNRDFKIGRKPSQSETAQFVDFLEKDLDRFHARLILAMDYHCCARSLIYPEIKKGNGFYKEQFNKIVTLMKTHVDPEYVSGVTKDIFGHATHGTLKGYWYKKFGALSFTYEGSDPKEEFKKFNGHMSWWKDLMGVVVDVYDNRLAELTPEIQNPSKTGEAPALYTE